MSASLGRILALTWGVTAASAAALAAQGASTAIPPGVQLEVYATALEFYSPPRGQVRWIEPTLLAVGDEEPGKALDAGLRRALIARLGDRFRPWVEGASGSGGRIRVSPIQVAGTDRYRLTVEYRHRTPYFEASPSTQAFVVGRADDRWRILARDGDTSADSS